jgi:DNA-binding transcriptional LysR family regulator
LASHLCINRCLTSSGALVRWPFAKRDARVEIAVEGPLTLQSDDLMLRAALDGVGVAFLSEADVLPHLKVGSLVRTLEAWCPPVYGFFLYHPRNRQVPASLAALIAALAVPEE